ncbi:hypothetical protein chiPu_0026481, partial [Chiloscyllium punctatum]|nr:hypothetical protein [Chiloscyllium punctatum]
CLAEKTLFKILLVLDNAPWNVLALDPNVKVIVLPPNATPRLQPKDQGIITSFKVDCLRWSSQAYQDDAMSLKERWRSYNIYDGFKNIADAWEEVNKIKVKGVRDKLCPQSAAGFTEFRGEGIAEGRQAVGDIGNKQLQ